MLIATGTNQTHVQDYNRRLILNAIRVRGRMSRADLVRATRLSSPAVSTIVESLVQERLVREAGERSVSRGRAPIDYEIEPDGAYAIGLNLNRDSLVATLVDLAGEERKRVLVDLNAPTPSETLPKMREFVRRLQAPIPDGRLWGIGVGVPGPIEPESELMTPVDLEAWHRIRIDQRTFDDVAAPVFVENNATAAAIGEQWYGVGQWARTFYYVFFGVGLGGGLIADGLPYRGATGNVARLGRTLVPDDAGGAVPLESEVSLVAIYRRLRSAGVPAASTEDLLRLHHDGDRELAAALACMADRLVRPIYNVEMQFDPEVIVFGGRLPRPLLEQLADLLDDRLDTARPGPDPRFARLATAEAGEESAALGAATLPVYHALAPQHDLVSVRNTGRGTQRRHA